MQTNLVRGIDLVYEEQANLIVFALTGRTGSGCTTAAKHLSLPFQDITISAEGLEQPEQRKISMVVDYARANWIPFQTITVSSVIFSFLLDEPESLNSFLGRSGLDEPTINELTVSLSGLLKHQSFNAFRKAMAVDSTIQDKAAAWSFFDQEVSPLLLQIRRILGGKFAPLFQTLGDNLRFSGNALDSTVVPGRLFTLMVRICKLVGCIQVFQESRDERRTRVVIDAIRNPIELVYLRKQIAGLYVIAITADNEERRSRLIESALSKKDIDTLDEKEYEHKGKSADPYSTFVSQNLKVCIQKSDIFVANPGKVSEFASRVGFMNRQLVRYVALALRPGLVTPTRDERCMQIAFVAKLNSGCISRQVGAVLADAEYSVHAIGWNDTPKGQTPCLLRDVSALLNGRDSESFSDYEKNDPKFRHHVDRKFSGRQEIMEAQGLHCPFCFKDAFNATKKEVNQVHTRSLHAEENAFLQLAKRGGPGIVRGVLYTTASPCELCSKKAFQLGIQEVVYVDPYPGISMTHVLKSGPESVRPKLRLFSGAVGHAYHRLYDALLPIKDEYSARLSEVETRSTGELSNTPEQSILPLGG